MIEVRRALISVSDKTGVAEFARRLVACGVELVASGGTAVQLRAADLPVTDVAAVTGSDEMLGGRVKTLHPLIHGAILARRDRDADEIESIGLRPIDLVVVNLYPFVETVRSGADETEVVEQIDIGGPAMIRAAAKNHEWVGVVVDPSDYLVVAEAIEAGGLGDDLRRRLARRAFYATASYDAAIVDHLEADDLPEHVVVAMERSAMLRYGENPHQEAAAYVGLAAPWWSDAELVQGKPLSYNNLADADAAWRLTTDLPAGSAVVVKHTNPCGAAVGAATPRRAVERAWECDPLSAFGGIVGIGGELDAEAAEFIVANFVEVVIARSITDDAREVMATRPNRRVLIAREPTNSTLEWRSIDGGMLVQHRDAVDATGWNVVTGDLDDAHLADLETAWTVAAHTKSNAVVIVKDGDAVGVGAGDQSRVGAAERAVQRAGTRSKGAVAASDAFFPFADGVETLVEAGVTAIVSPGGSKGDADVIEAAAEAGVTMVFTGTRHFRH